RSGESEDAYGAFGGVAPSMSGRRFLPTPRRWLGVGALGSRTLGALNMAQDTSRFRRVGIDVGHVITGKDATNGGVMSIAFDDCVGLVDHHAIIAEGTVGDEPVSDDVRDGVPMLKALTFAGAHEDGRRLAISTSWLGRLVGEEKNATLAGCLAQAMPARIGAINIET